MSAGILQTLNDEFRLKGIKDVLAMLTEAEEQMRAAFP